MRLLPDWIQAYMAYTIESRSPDEFHLWTALITIAGALRRKVYFNFEYFLLYPNLYVVLVGPPGKCKKSTAMRIGRKFLSRVPGINLSTESTSRERLIQDLAQSYADGHSSMTAFSSEFASLLSTSGVEMIVFLTDIYDCPEEWTHKTKTGGPNKIKAPFLNLEAGTTPDWISRALPLDTIGIGLAARVIFVYQDTPRIRKPFPKLTPEQIKLEELLTNDLIHISQLSGEYIMDEEALQLYEEWDLQNQKERINPDVHLAGYYERKPMHVIKIAMILAASRKDELVITKNELQQALGLLEAIEPRMSKTFAGVGKNPLAADIVGVLETIQANPGIPYAMLLDLFKHSVRREELDEVLGVLVSTGKIKMVPDERGPTYQPRS
jgi:hypothetical protein